MKRRDFFKKAGVATAGAAAVATTLAAPAISQGNITWRMVTTWPKNFPGLGVGAQRLADRITAASGGRLSVQVYAAGEMVPGLQALDAVIDGSAEMSHGAAYYWQNKSMGLSFYTGVPYGMTNRELAAWVRHMGGQELWDEIYDQFGLQGFLSGDTGTQAGGWFRNELTGVSDIQGLRFRSPGLGGQVWERLGASVTNLAAGDIFAALQNGTLDAAEFVGPYNDLAASTRSPRTTISRASSSRVWPPNSWSTRPNTRNCPRTCRTSSASSVRPNMTRSPPTSPPTIRAPSRRSSTIMAWWSSSSPRKSSRPAPRRPWS
jgi:TRAP-type mannitol/chloroaromatic compound transport system substrate-binding protein